MRCSQPPTRGPDQESSRTGDHGRIPRSSGKPSQSILGIACKAWRADRCAAKTPPCLSLNCERSGSRLRLKTTRSFGAHDVEARTVQTFAPIERLSACLRAFCSDYSVPDAATTSDAVMISLKVRATHALECGAFAKIEGRAELEDLGPPRISCDTVNIRRKSA